MINYLTNVCNCFFFLNVVNIQYLLTCEELEKYNFRTISKIYNDPMHLLWPSGVNYDKVLFFCFLGLSMMKSANSLITVYFPNLILLTCFSK